MQLIPFLEQLHTFSPTTSSYICFTTAATESSVAQAALLKKIKMVHAVAVESLDMQVLEYAQVVSTLEISFLGMRLIYWLRNIPPATTKEGKVLALYIKNYTGPHCLIYCVAPEHVPSSDNGIVVELPDVVTKQQFIKLLTSESADVARKSSAVVVELFAKATTLPLENAYMLIRYLALLGNNQQEFIRSWLDSLITPEKSLFLLSGHFFAKDAKAFFTQWALMRDEYPDVFWVTFWSEQIWRASQVLYFMQQKNPVEAKKISFRLPFSFMQRDWRKTTYTQLQTAHDFLYTIDYGLKNGGDNGILDLFFTQFFMISFAQQ